MEGKILDTNDILPNDLNLVLFGFEDCAPGHSFGPAIRKCYLMHFVTDGCGKFEINGREYALQKGDMFLIPPDIATVYRASFETPWSYIWVGMRGIILPTYIEASGLSAENPVIKYSDTLLKITQKIVKATENISHKSPFITGLLYLFFDELIKCGGGEHKYKTGRQIYAENAVNYINNNLHRKISVSAIADHIGIDRSYLCSIFKNLLGCSPQTYILNAKTDMAKRLLSTTNNEIKDIGEALGYSDQFSFSHAFKEKTGISPRRWREKYKNN